LPNVPLGAGYRAPAPLAPARRRESARETSRAPLWWLVAVATLVAGCASADLDVIRPVPFEIDRVVLTVRDDTRGDMSPSDVEDFRNTILDALEDADVAVVDPDARGASRVLGKVERYDPGIRAIRYVSGYGLGTGKMVTVWEVKDGRSQDVARCRIEGSVSLGTFGGSIVEVQEEMGRALARFLKGNIR